MKRKVVSSLFCLFLFITVGAITATVYITNTTSELEDIIELHQIEELRRSLVIDIQNVQNDIHTLDSGTLDTVVNNVLALQETASQCKTCHHRPVLAKRIDHMQYLVEQYGYALSFFVTAEKRKKEELKTEAAEIGDKLVQLTGHMSTEASHHLDELTSDAINEIQEVKAILFATLSITFLLGIIIAMRLIRHVTFPVNELVKATRKISSGKLGTLIDYRDNTEFGELATHFNKMSMAVKNGYEKMEEEARVRHMAEEALIKSEKFLSTIFDSIRDPFCIFDRSHNIVRANEAYSELMKDMTDVQEVRQCLSEIKNNGRKCRECVVEKTFKSQDPCAIDDLTIIEDGSKIWFEIYTYPIFNEYGEVSHVIEYIRDITDRKLAEMAMRESEERYALSARGANDGLWDWDLKNDKVYFSYRWKGIIGADDKEIKSSLDEWTDRIHPDERGNVEDDLDAHIRGLTPRFKSEHRIRHKDGAYRWVLVRGLCVKGGHRIAGSMTDITSRKKVEEQLEHEALHDSLTGLPNRVLFMDRLNHAVKREKRSEDYIFAVIFVDMDRFKMVNDTLGHTIGDTLLVAVSNRLAESLRPGDTVARLGGDEFAVLLEDLKTEREASHVTKRIQDKMVSPFNINGQEVYLSASIGITFSNNGYDHPENLLRDADIAMYHAKAKGRSRQEIFDTVMYDNMVNRMHLETDLRRAIETGQLTLCYQPIMSVKTGKIAGFEALVRWIHPEKGIIAPSEFIPMAEDTGLIIPLGNWVLNEACTQMSAWQKQFGMNNHFKISVNISSRQFLPLLIEKVTAVLDQSELMQGSLIMEITESMLMENAETAAPLCRELKEMNIQIHIDDFGTGYSSLSYLHNFPIDALKIDRSFVSRLGMGDEDHKIIRAIATLSHSMNIDVIAEGVETRSQYLHLKALKCKYMQGYYFSKPLDKVEAEAFLKRSKLKVLTSSAP